MSSTAAPRREERIDFIGIGAPRSGTTWLSECLREHPQVLLSHDKELHFFTRGIRHGEGTAGHTAYARGLAWYLDQFPSAEPGKIRGEFSPAYLRDTESAARIRAAFPEVKIIAMFRDPADMIYSFYWFLRYRSPHRVAFREAIERGDYLTNGRYHTNLQPFLERFPRERVLILFYDDVRSDPVRVFATTCRFLGVRDDLRPPSLTRRVNAANRSRASALSVTLRKAAARVARSSVGRALIRTFLQSPLYRFYRRTLFSGDAYPPMEAADRAWLVRHFHDEIVKLEGLTGRDLSSWRTA